MEEKKSLQALRQSIVLGIGKQERRLAKVYISTFSGACGASFVGVVASFYFMIKGFYESGFYHYVALFFSGEHVAFLYWREVSYALIETVPVVTTIGFLIMLGVFIWSGVNTLSTVRKFSLLAH